MQFSRNRPVHQFLVRYIKLLILAFVGYLVVYFSAFAAMEYQALRKRQEASALNAKIYMDTVLNNMAQTSYLLRGNSFINKVMYSPLTAAPYDYVEAYQEISRQVTQIDLLDSCYVYIIPTETVLVSNYGKYTLAEFYDSSFLLELVPRSSPCYTVHIPSGPFAPSGADYLVQSIRYTTTVRNDAGLVCMNLSRSKLQQELNTFVEAGWQIELSAGGTPLLGTLPTVQAQSGYYLTAFDLDQAGLTVTVAVSKRSFYREMASRFIRSSLLFIAFAAVVGFLLTALLSSFNDTFRSIVLQLAKHYSSRDSAEFRLQDLPLYFEQLVDDNKAYATRLQETAHIVQEKLLMDLLTGKPADEEEFERLCEYMDVDLPHPWYMAACIDIDGRETAATPREILNSKALIKEMLEQRGDPVVYTVLECDGEVGAVINYSSRLEGAVRVRMEKLVEALREKLEEEEHLNLFVSFSKPVPREELASAFAKARYNVNYKYLPNKLCYLFDETPGLAVGNLVSRQLIQTVLSAVNAQTYTAAYGQIRGLAEACQPENAEDIAQFRATLLVLCGSVLDCVGKGSGAGRLKSHASAVTRLCQADSADGLCTAFFSFLGGISKDVAGRGHPYNVNQYVSKAVDFITASYNQDITVGTIAEHLNLNAKYFSRLFKEHTGMTVMQFLSDLRMKQASRLLCETNRTVRDIGEQVGFADSRSFIRHFKRYFGTTPGEFRVHPREVAVSLGESDA